MKFKVGDKVICIKEFCVSFYPWWESNLKDISDRSFKVGEFYEVLSEPVPGEFFLCDIEHKNEWFVGKLEGNFAVYKNRVEKLRRILEK